MQVVLLAGGFGTRLSEETTIRPKPMVEIGNEPIIWHIMKIYSYYGYNDFIICAGYKQEIIKEYFSNYYLTHGDFEFHTKSGTTTIIKEPGETWNVKIVNTGMNTMTGGRIKRIKSLLGDDTFMLTYGDGLANINIKKLLDYHYKHGKSATISAVKPVGRYGALVINKEEIVSQFTEKPPGDGVWVNGGFFVLEPKVIDLIEGDSTVWEQGPLANLAERNQLVAYKHNGFWRPMDTMSDKRVLEQLWSTDNAPWKVWYQ